MKKSQEISIFTFDIETLDTESTSVILSAAILHWSPQGEFNYQDLLDRSLFVKFNVSEQLKLPKKRTISKDTVAWWEKQHEIVKKKSVYPSTEDDSIIDGLEKLRGYLKEHSSDNNIIWIRGSLDQVAIDSLAVASGVEKIAPYNSYRDVRTAIDLLCDTAKNGYCDVSLKGYDPIRTVKHDPRHDCAIDTVMLKFGI